MQAVLKKGQARQKGVSLNCPAVRPARTATAGLITCRAPHQVAGDSSSKSMMSRGRCDMPSKILTAPAAMHDSVAATQKPRAKAKGRISQPCLQGRQRDCGKSSRKHTRRERQEQECRIRGPSLRRAVSLGGCTCARCPWNLPAFCGGTASLPRLIWLLSIGRSWMETLRCPRTHTQNNGATIKASSAAFDSRPR